MMDEQLKKEILYRHAERVAGFEVHYNKTEQGILDAMEEYAKAYALSCVPEGRNTYVKNEGGLLDATVKHYKSAGFNSCRQQMIDNINNQ